MIECSEIRPEEEGRGGREEERGELNAREGGGRRGMGRASDCKAETPGFLQPLGLPSLSPWHPRALHFLGVLS